jgi:hypothetical protein
MHAFKILKILDIVLKDTPISEKLEHELVPLVEPIDTTSEIPIDDLTIGVKHVVFND